MPEANIQQNSVRVKGAVPYLVVPHRMIDLLLPKLGKDTFILLLYLMRHGDQDKMPIYARLKERTGLTSKRVKAGIAALRDAGILRWMPPTLDERAVYVIDLDSIDGGGKPDEGLIEDTVELERIIKRERSDDEQKNIPPVLRQAPDAVIDTCLAVWDAWLGALPADRAVTRYHLTHDRARSILKAIKLGFSSEELVMAVKGWKYDPWESRENYIDLRHLFKSTEHIEMFIRFYKDGTGGKPIGKKGQPSRYRKLGKWE